MLDKESYRYLNDFFSMLSDITRLKIIEFLLDKEENVSEIAKAIDSSISNTSHQLNRLKQYKIVKARKEGKYTYYSLLDQHVSDIYKYAVEHIQE